jgi:DNA repair protein RadA/Sms
MAKRTSSYVCQNCGAVYQRWQGKCDACGEWNSIAEETSAIAAVPASQRSRGRGRVFALETLTGATDEAPRLVSGIAELDRVTGGGFVRGSVLLLGGDPGIGKSTLLIQTCASLARSGVRAVYISGEEAAAQVRLRADRLGLADSPVELAAETSVEDILATLEHGPSPRFVIIDSRRSSLSAMSPRTARSPAPVWSSIWSTQSCPSRATAGGTFVSCAP